MSSRLHQPPGAAVSWVERLVERAMTFAVEEYDDELAVARLTWPTHDDLAALDQACDVCLSYIEVDLGIRGRAIGLLAQVLHPDLPPDRRRRTLTRSRTLTGRPATSSPAHLRAADDATAPPAEPGALQELLLRMVPLYVISWETVTDFVCCVGQG